MTPDTPRRAVLHSAAQQKPADASQGANSKKLQAGPGARATSSAGKNEPPPATNPMGGSSPVGQEHSTMHDELYDAPATSASPFLRAALDSAARGWPVFPLHSPTKRGVCSCGREDCGNVGKHPRTASGFKDATTDEAQIRRWWLKWPYANLGIATGSKSGLFVLDVDPDHGGLESLKAIQDVYDFLPFHTLISLTGGGGLHFVLRHPGSGYLLPGGTRLDGFAGLDWRSDGGYIVAPPSMHASGVRYEWRDVTVPPAALPAWLRDLVLRPREEEYERPPAPRESASLEDETDAIAYWLEKALGRASEGTRNATGFWLACQLRDSGVREASAGDALLDYALRVPGSGYSGREALSSCRQAFQRPPREEARAKSIETLESRKRTSTGPRTDGSSAFAYDPVSDDDHGSGQEPPDAPPPPPARDLPIHQTDLGNARRFTARHGEGVRYVAAWGKWLLWDGTRWLKDETDAVKRLGKETVAALYQEAAETEDDAERKELAKWALRSEGETRLRAMLSLAESEASIALAGGDLDREGWLLNARNGTVDLRTGILLPHEPTHLLTKRAEAPYDANAPCDAWDRFMDQTFAGDPEIISYVQRAVGYSLTQEMGEQCAFVLHGGGANGKSTFVDTLTRVLADYAMTTPTETLMVKSGSHIPSDVARLVGARFVAASEASDGRRLDEELIKRITGGDRMAARFLNHDWFEFYPVLKLWLAVNHKPTIRGTDLGIWRRIHLIPFAVTVPPEKQDRALVKKLLTEASGILAWAVRGCLAWQKAGLNPPKVVQDATAAYRSEMDTIGRFLEECCTTARGAQASAKMLYEAYKLWCSENGEREQTQTRFGSTLGDKGFTRDRGAGGATLWRGIGLNAGPTQSEFEG